MTAVGMREHLPSLLLLLCDQGKFEEAWELELRHEARIQWEIQQEEAKRG